MRSLHSVLLPGWLSILLRVLVGMIAILLLRILLLVLWLAVPPRPCILAFVPSLAILRIVLRRPSVLGLAVVPVEVIVRSLT